MSRSILILGATSILAQRIGLTVVNADDRVLLAARDTKELAIVASNLKARTGAFIVTLRYDSLAFDKHSLFCQNAINEIGVPDIIVVATGTLGDQTFARSDIHTILEIGASNFLGISTTIAPLANEMERKGTGHLIVLSSVAGDRGRASNYIYGSSKAGVSALLSGLRARLHRAGVRVSTVKLGFVDTQMVFGKPGMFLVADPDWVATKIRNLIDSPKDVVYIPAFWRLIMLLIKVVPEVIFKRLYL